MAKGIQDLGNGNGFIYSVKPDKTTIVQAYPNDEVNARGIKVEGLKATSSALNQSPFATITVDTITDAGSLTAITVNGVNQINTAVPIAYLGADTTASLAQNIAAAINSFTADVGEDYTAFVEGSVVSITGEESIGSSHNGVTPIVTITVGATFSITAVNGGSDAKSLYNEAFGFTFFLDADYGATECTGSGTATADSIANAVEITNEIVPRHLNSALPKEEPTISSGSINFDRSSTIINVIVDTESAAASDDLDTINSTGFAEGDIIVCRGANSGRVTTFKDGTGNISLVNDVDFLTGATEVAIMLQLIGSAWVEVARGSQAIGSMSDYRTAGFGFFGVDTFTTQVISPAGTVTFDGGTSSKVQQITGSDTLTANSSYDLGTGVNGDEFTLNYDSSTILNGFTLSIFGISLSLDQALNGGLVFKAKYVSGAWKSSVCANLDRAIAFPYVIPTEGVKDEAITVSKLFGTLKSELLIFPISWDANRLGDHKIVVPFDCDFTRVDLFANDLIEATDDADANFKDNGGLSMGTISLTAGTLIGTGGSITPTSNNSFTAGQVMTVTTTKTTAGGNGLVSIIATRT